MKWLYAIGPVILAVAIVYVAYWLQFGYAGSDHQRLNRLEAWQASHLVPCDTDTNCETKNP